MSNSLLQKRNLNLKQLILVLILGLFAFTSIMPLFLVLAVSFSSEASIGEYGYSFFPRELSWLGYRYLLVNGSAVLRSFMVSLSVTIGGTLLGVFLMAMYAYPLSRRDFYFRNFFTFYIFFTMLFSGGLVPTYLVITKLLGLQNTLLALIVPLAFSPFSVIILRTFFQSIPSSIIESCRIDGAREWTVFLRIILPMSAPGIATIGLFLAVGYWNDWFQALLYIRNETLLPLQAFLQRIQENLQFLSNYLNVSVEVVTALGQLPTETARMAIVVLTTLPILVSYPFFQRFFISGLTIGAIKG